MTTTPEDGLTKHRDPFAIFRARVETEMVGGETVYDSTVATMSGIGNDWYVFQGTGLHGYVIANQGHAGGDLLLATRQRPVEYWTTNEGLSKLQAWDIAIEFITAQVHADLKDEWGETPGWQ